MPKHNVCLVIKSDLLCVFHSAISYGIIFWGNSLHSSIIFRIQKKAIRIMKGCGNIVLYRNLFKKLEILPLISQYIYIIFINVCSSKQNFFLNKK